MTFREILANLNKVAIEHPEYLDLECVTTNDQCAHYEVSGHAFKEDVSEWPSEYCIDECLSGTTFVRIS